MDKLIESMSNINVRKNDGYLFIKRDEIYVPIMKTILLITKRSFYSLPLLDEIVLRLINEGIQEIDELVNILGIDRKLLECSRDKVVQVKTEYYLSLVFDEKYIITGVPKDIVIMDSNTHIHKVEFYLQVM